MRTYSGLVSGTAAAVIAWSAMAHDPGYFSVDLGTLGGVESHATGINSAGIVVGVSTTATGVRRAFRWTETAGMTSLDDGIANDINDAGLIVGAVDYPDGSTRAAAWAPQGHRVDLGTLGGFNSEALSLNESNHVVGWSETSDGAVHAFVYRNGAMIDLGLLPGGDRAEARAINEAGVIVGVGYVAGRRRPFRYADGVMTALSALSDADAEALGINDLGQAVGWSETDEGESYAVLWEPDGTIVNLGLDSPTLETFAYTANNVDRAVGTAFFPAFKEDQAAMWINGQFNNINAFLLPGSPWDYLASASDVNDSGQIVGTGVINGLQRAFILEPALGLADPIPGDAGVVNTFDAAGAEPGGTVYFIYGFNYGNGPVPGCPDARIGIERPQLLGIKQADNTGHALLDRMVPRAARNRTVLLQAIEPSTCEDSILAIWTFR